MPYMLLLILPKCLFQGDQLLSTLVSLPGKLEVPQELDINLRKQISWSVTGTIGHMLIQASYPLHAFLSELLRLVDSISMILAVLIVRCVVLRLCHCEWRWRIP